MCKNNPQHDFGSHLVDCPWCQRKALFCGLDPFPRLGSPPPRRRELPARKPVARTSAIPRFLDRRAKPHVLSSEQDPSVWSPLPTPGWIHHPPDNNRNQSARKPSRRRNILCCSKSLAILATQKYLKAHFKSKRTSSADYKRGIVTAQIRLAPYNRLSCGFRTLSASPVAKTPTPHKPDKIRLACL